MSSIYKRSADADDKRSPWIVGYTDENGVRRTVKGFTDKRQTELLAAKLETEVMLRKRGLIDPALESIAAKRRKPLTEHLKAFEKSLGNNTGKHVKLTLSRIRCVVNGLNAKTLDDLSTEKVEDFLAGLAKTKDLGNRTYNHYVQALDEFCAWLVEKKRAVSNPVIGMQRLNTEIDVRHRRRALTAEEIIKLVQSARESDEEIQCFDGETRARIYTLAYLTGLRRNEIGSLTPESFNLVTEPPTVTVEAAFSKHRRRDVIPLHPELVTLLRAWLPDYSAGTVMFPKLGKRRTWRMVKLDLKRVGIAYETADGIADFHAAGRHTHITELLRNGASLPEAKELARHSDINMTMRYTHIGINDQAKALKHLRWKPAETSAAEVAGEPSPTPAAAQKNENGAQHISSESGVSACQSGASGDTAYDQARSDATPVGDRGCRVFSLSSSESQEWRRRELNPRPEICPRRLLRA